MKTTYIATSAEAANLHSGKQTAIVTLVKPQPKDCFPIHQLAEELCTWRNEPMTMVHSHDNNGRFFCKYCGNGCEYGNGFKGINAPYQPGSTIAVRESYYYSNVSNGWEYKSDRVHSHAIPWRSPATMPRESVRTHLLVKDVQCVRVQDMTSEQAQAIWPEMNNIDRMQELHRKLGSDAWADNVFVFITIIEKQ